MNTLIANQYGRVQGEAGGCGLTLCVTAQTPRRESVELQTHVDSVEQQLHLLAILRAVAGFEPLRITSAHSRPLRLGLGRIDLR